MINEYGIHNPGVDWFRKLRYGLSAILGSAGLRMTLADVDHISATECPRNRQSLRDPHDPHPVCTARARSPAESDFD
ncbi:MAG: hypothetical protein ACK50J_00095 [Planctomyces sp.]